MEIQITLSDCIKGMEAMGDGSVDLVVTSPPYNVGIEYGAHDDDKGWDEYEKTMRSVISNLFRVVRDGGRVCWNIPSFSSRQNLYETFLRLFREAGFKQYAEIIWNKDQISSRTAWGSFCSASEPNILPSHEYILVFYKGSKNHGAGESDLTKEEFIPWTNGMWNIRPETDSNHPAPFPLALPKRLIKMFTYPGRLVMDPFMGSGTSGVAAVELGRSFIGFELDPKWHEMAQARIKIESEQGKLF